MCWPRGLARIRRLDAVTQIFDPEEMLPAPARGPSRWNAGPARPDLADLLACVDDPATHAATTAERRCSPRSKQVAAPR